MPTTGCPITGRSNTTRLPQQNRRRCSRIAPSSGTITSTTTSGIILVVQSRPSAVAATRVYAHNTTFENNEIAYNGREQKVVESANVTFRNNFVHHNIGDGIWNDSDNTGALIEGNRVEDNGRNGIFFEASGGGIIRNNTVRRNAGQRGVHLHVQERCRSTTTRSKAISGASNISSTATRWPRGTDVIKNNAAYDNTIVVGTQSYASASGFSYLSSCTATQLAAYLNGSKNLTFSRNTYRVPSLSGRYMFWGGWKYWNEWQALGHDVDGSISQ